jgi:2-polyprenyl-3-methyl-5-hydroxy-6-metoxy-1,4-benzoquinol methylase
MQIAFEPLLVCPVCGSSDRNVIYRDLRDRWFGVPGSWTLQRCTNCTLVYLNPRPTPTSLAQMYERYYTHSDSISTSTPQAHLRVGGKKSQKSVLKRLYRLALSPLEKKRLELYRNLTHLPPGRLLDVGCGDGRFLAYMRGLGWTVFGVEPDPRSAQTTIESLGIPVHIGTLKDARYPDETFDAVTLNHVIEHVIEPVDLLGECWRVLKTGGVLKVVTPNVMGLGYRLFGCNWRELDPPRHLYLFSPITLDQVFRKAGLSEASLSTTWVSADVIGYGSLQIQRIGRYAPRVVDRNLQLRSLAFLFLEMVWSTFKPFAGEELVFEAQKPYV